MGEEFFEMKRTRLSARVENAMWAAAVTMLVALPASSVNAEPPPREGCRAVYKIEYTAAKSKNLLRQKFGTYMRTGRFWRRFYWYCR